MNRDEIIEAELASRDGKLRYSMRHFVWAKDTAQKVVLLGGYGGFGLGSMWAVLTPEIEADPTYAEAPEREWPGETLARLGSFGWSTKAEAELTPRIHPGTL